MLTADILIGSTSPISLDCKHDSWNTKARPLWRLWNLLEAYARIYVVIASGIQELAQETENLDTSLDTLARANDAVRGALTSIREQMTSLPLHPVVDRIDRILWDLHGTIMEPAELGIQLKVLRQVFEDALKPMMFLYMPSPLAEQYQNPLAGLPKTMEAFPSTRYDIESMYRCHALGLHTACVYHAMGVAQAGLHALATELGVAFSYSLDLAEWQKIIEAIENKIEPMRHMPRTERDTVLPFYSECATQFRYFKDAWRNHVAHMREVYDRDQSHSIMIHVRDFMEQLSGRLKEDA